MLVLISGILASITAATISAWAVLRSRRAIKSKLELVDTSFSYVESPSDPRRVEPIVDIKVRNLGGQTAVIKRLDVHVLRISRPHRRVGAILSLFKERRFGAELWPSKTYDIRIPSRKSPASAAFTYSLSQEISPGTADRFQFDLGFEQSPAPQVFLLKLELIYDGDDRKILLPTLAVATKEDLAVNGPLDLREAIEATLSKLADIRGDFDALLDANGMPVPDWKNDPPKSESEFLKRYDLIDSAGELRIFRRDALNRTQADFWEADTAFKQRLVELEENYRDLINIIESAEIMQPSLRGSLIRLKMTLPIFPGLHEEFLSEHGALRMDKFDTKLAEPTSSLAAPSVQPVKSESAAAGFQWLMEEEPAAIQLAYQLASLSSEPIPFAIDESPGILVSDFEQIMKLAECGFIRMNEAFIQVEPSLRVDICRQISDKIEARRLARGLFDAIPDLDPNDPSDRKIYLSIGPHLTAIICNSSAGENDPKRFRVLALGYIRTLQINGDIRKGAEIARSAQANWVRYLPHDDPDILEISRMAQPSTWF